MALSSLQKRFLLLHVSRCNPRVMRVRDLHDAMKRDPVISMAREDGKGYVTQPDIARCLRKWVSENVLITKKVIGVTYYGQGPRLNVALDALRNKGTRVFSLIQGSAEKFE